MGASLATLAEGRSAIIDKILAPPGDSGAEAHVRRMMALGFVPGAPVRVVAKGFPAGEPIAVRIGGATFALRAFEAAWIHVHKEDPG